MPLHRSAATLLVAVPLALALVPLALPPWTFALVVLRIALAELGPALAVAALVLGTIAARMGPGPRWPFALGALAAAGLALIPTISAQRAAGAGVAAVDALPLGGHDGETPLHPVVAGPNRLLGAVLGLPRPRQVMERVLQYAAADGSPLTLRVYRDTLRTHGGRPTVVVLYAGAWQNGDAAQGAPLQRWLAAYGYLVVALDYRHAPRFQHPAQLDDVRAGLALVRDSAAAWGGDPARVALLGRSSGGHLAMLAAWGTPPLPIRGVVDFYGPFDLARGYVDRPSPDPLDVRAVLRAFLGGAPNEMPDRYRDASPASLVRPGLPPALLVYAGSDHLVKPEFGRDAAAALRRSGVPVAYVELPWAEHGFDLAAGGPAGTAAMEVVLRFLARVL